MMRLLSCTGCLLALAGRLAASPAEAADKPATLAEQYQSLLKQFSTASRIIWEPTTDEERTNAVARVEKLPLKLLELAEKNPKDPIAVDALIQVVAMEYWLNTYSSHPGWGNESRQARAIALMLRDHLDSEKLGDASKRVLSGFRQECETFLRTVLEKSPHREVRALACLRLAQFLPGRLEKLDLLADQPELAKRYETLYGKAYLEKLRQLDRSKVIQEAGALYEQVIEKYGDVKFPDGATAGGTVGDTARTELFEIRTLAVGKEAQEMEGVDQDGRQFKLSDNRGKVVLLYFWSEF